MTQATPTSRVAWLDTGRGIAIVLVVLLHTSEWLEVIGLSGQKWAGVNEMLASLRMPLFFAAAGLLGASWVRRRGWGDIVSKKVLFLMWAYLMWQPIYSIVALLQAQLTGDDMSPFRMVVSLGLSPLRPRFELWFLWALALFFVVGRALADRLVRTQFVLAAAVSAYFLAEDFVTGNLGWDGAAKYYLFFLAGVYGREVLLRLGASITRLRAFGLIGVWAVLAVVTYQTGLVHVPGVSLSVRMLGLFAGIALAVQLVPTRIFGYLGSRTLQIYVGHMPAITLLVWLVSLGKDAGFLHTISPALPVLITVPVVAMTLAFHAAVTPVAPWLYSPPAWAVALVRSFFPAPRARGRHLAETARRSARAGPVDPAPVYEPVIDLRDRPDVPAPRAPAGPW